MAVKMKTKPTRPIAEPDTYFALVREFPLKPVRTSAEYETAVDFLGKIELAGRTRDPGGEDYAAALTEMIRAYDSRQEKLDTSLHGLDALKFLMHTAGLNVSAVGKIIGSQGTASDVLAGKRGISKGIAQKLGNHFKLDYRLFL